MRATFAGFNTAFSALQASQKRLDVTGQNIANVYTVGYTRQRLDVSSLGYGSSVNPYNNSGNSSIVGFGVSMDGVSQIRDPYLDVQYRNQIRKNGYCDALQGGYDGMSTYFDESNQLAIGDALIQLRTALSNMQQSETITNPVYEAEVKAAMENFTNLLNQAADKLEELKKLEQGKLDGGDTSKNGAVQKVNDLLERIGTLNRQIAVNDVMGNPSLEMRDERNVLLDELASYLPIETKTVPTEDGKGETIEVVLKGEPETVLVSGNTKDFGKDPSKTNYSQISYDKENNQIKVETQDGTGVTIGAGDGYTGSIQGSLDLLNTNVTEDGTDGVRGFAYYENQLNKLAQEFAKKFNEINNKGNANPADLLEGDGTGSITAANIKISDDWKSGKIGIDMSGDSKNEKVLEMLQALEEDQESLGGNSFADFYNTISTTLATDSKANLQDYKTETAILNTIQASRDEISAVSMDEEAANMMQYMQCYNAAARLMTAMDQALTTLLGMGTVGR